MKVVLVVFKYYFKVWVSFYKFSVSCCLVYLMHVASNRLNASNMWHSLSELVFKCIPCQCLLCRYGL